MLEMLRRENRIVDIQIVGNLLNGAAFFASTTILAVGGLFALLATGLAFRSRVGALLMLGWNVLVVSILVCAFTRSSYTFASMDHFLNGVYFFALSLLALWGGWTNFRAAGPS